jgi:hypothetical protein
MLFDQEELEAWLKQGRIDGRGNPSPEMPVTTALHQGPDPAPDLMDISQPRVYHRRQLYQ